MQIITSQVIIIISPLIFWDAWLISAFKEKLWIPCCHLTPYWKISRLASFSSTCQDWYITKALIRIVLGRLPLIHMVMGLSLQAFWQKELILRRNFGYSHLETARTTEGGVQPPGLTMEKIKRKAGLSQFYIWIFSLFLPFSLRARSGSTIRGILNFSNQTLIPNKRG